MLDQLEENKRIQLLNVYYDSQEHLAGDGVVLEMHAAGQHAAGEGGGQ